MLSGEWTKRGEVIRQERERGRVGIRNVDGVAIQSVGQTSKLVVRRLGLVARLGRSFTFIWGN